MFDITCEATRKAYLKYASLIGIPVDENTRVVYVPQGTEVKLIKGPPRDEHYIVERVMLHQPYVLISPDVYLGFSSKELNTLAVCDKREGNKWQSE